MEAVVITVLALQVSGALASVNTTTATLLVIMVLVAMIPFATSINFPGGGGFTLGSTSAAAALVRQVVGDAAQAGKKPAAPKSIQRLRTGEWKTGYSVPLPRAPFHMDYVLSKASPTEFEVQSTSRATQPQWKALVGSNPVMGIAAMRYDLEEHLRNLASSLSVQTGPAADVHYLVRSLGAAGVLTSKEQEAVLAVADLANQAVHSRRIDAAAAEELSSMAEDVLILLGTKDAQPS